MARVLIADHDILVCNTLAELLRELGHSVACAYCDTSAMDRISTGERPDLIIANLTTTRLDGWRLLRWLRFSPTLCRTQIIVHSDKTDELRAMAEPLGVSSFWQRGRVSFEQMCNSLDQCLGKPDRQVA